MKQANPLHLVIAVAVFLPLLAFVFHLRQHYPGQTSLLQMAWADIVAILGLVLMPIMILRLLGVIPRASDDH